MAQAKAWLIEQLGGERRILTLTGWGAPFGRPRQGAVVSTPIVVRTELTRYPGGVNTTRHDFGYNYEPWELHGRFRDKDPNLGKGGARLKAKLVESFLSDRQPVRISWGDILAYTGFLTSFEPRYESEAEIEWVLKADIDVDESAETLPEPAQPKTPQDSSAAIIAAMLATEEAIADVPLPGDLLDLLGSLIGVLAGAAGDLRDAAESVRSVKDATFSQLNRITSAISQVRAAGIALRETYMSLPADAATFSTRTQEAVRMLSSQVTVEEQLRAMLAESAELERAATVAKAGKVKTTHVAGNGETWEGVSSKHFRTPNRAAEIREANELGPGEKPRPGFEYVIPD